MRQANETPQRDVRGANCNSSFMKRSGGARVKAFPNGDKGHMEPFMQNEAKYMLERPVVNLNLTSCLTKDDMDLRVTICHIRGESV
jgi:hypothetical protein